MKQAIPLPAVLAVVAVVVVVAAIFLMKIANADAHTPRPDPAMFAPHSATSKTAVTN